MVLHLSHLDAPGSRPSQEADNGRWIPTDMPCQYEYNAMHGICYSLTTHHLQEDFNELSQTVMVKPTVKVLYGC